MVTVEQLKQYKKIKKNFARQFNANESTVQLCADEIISICNNNSGIINPILMESFAQTDTTKLHNMFNWEETQEYRLVQAEAVLESIPFLIGSDGKVYNINKQN